MSTATQAAEVQNPGVASQGIHSSAKSLNADASWLRFLAHYLRPWRGRFMLLALLLFASIGLTLAGPQLVSLFINNVTANALQQTLILIAVLALVAALTSQGVTVLATYVGQDLGWATTNM